MESKILVEIGHFTYDGGVFAVYHDDYKVRF